MQIHDFNDLPLLDWGRLALPARNDDLICDRDEGGFGCTGCLDLDRSSRGTVCTVDTRLSTSGTLCCAPIHSTAVYPFSTSKVHVLTSRYKAWCVRMRPSAAVSIHGRR